MIEPVKGRIFKFGDNINSDVIIPGRYLIYIDPEQLAEHAFEVLGDGYPDKLRDFQILVAGKNFGCGSAREQAATALIGLGFKAVVAKSFSRTFYRNAINAGLPIVECADLVDAVSEGDEIVIDLASGGIRAGDRKLTFQKIPDSVLELLEVGGLAEYLKAQQLRDTGGGQGG